MTAKEELRHTVDELIEAEVANTLDSLARRREPRDTLGELLAGAPLDDEPTAPEEDGARESRVSEQIARGEVLSAEQSCARSLDRRMLAPRALAASSSARD